MPDLRQTRRQMKTALAVLLAVDVAALVLLISPVIGSVSSRRQELNQLWAELRTKTRQVEPLANLPKRVDVAKQQINDFYKRRFPAQDSEIASQFGKLAAANGVTIEQARYKVLDQEVGRISPVEIEAGLSGNYVSLAKFINALERDDMFFIISSISLAGEQKGPIKLDLKLETYLKAGA
ncbi:MAG TPA: hypothetical protein VND65_20280 [Candidatus Binatia bacterium]|nr:hypothetical protein [Candidatus Binatia bacterium]